MDSALGLGEKDKHKDLQPRRKINFDNGVQSTEAAAGKPPSVVDLCGESESSDSVQVQFVMDRQDSNFIPKDESPNKQKRRTAAERRHLAQIGAAMGVHLIDSTPEAETREARKEGDGGGKKGLVYVR